MKDTQTIVYWISNTYSIDGLFPFKILLMTTLDLPEPLR